ncbi:MAG: aspartate--tRNA(Asn) ligase [Candidatus Woesearchaeota archaeon]
MERTLIKDIKPGKVLLQGWVHEIRDMSKIKFLILRDRSGIAQCIAKPDQASAFEAIPKLSIESVVEVEGEAKKSEVAKLGVEIVAETVKVLNKAESPLPIPVVEKGVTTEFSTRLDNRFLDLRKEKQQAIFRVRSKIYAAAAEYFEKIGFTNINTPKITSAGVESGAELFEVDYFGKPAYLSQSPQIYKQMMVAAGFERVYEIAPVFRAEKSHTTRHLTEFTGIDFEMGFIESEHDVMDVIENLVRAILKKVHAECKEELAMFDVAVEVPEKFPRITMKEAKELLAERGKEMKEDEDLDAEAEKLLGEIIKTKYNSEFVFVCNYPFAVRPFYHMKPEGDEKGTKSFDLIWNGVEVATGAQREHRYEVLKAQGKEKGVDVESMKDYAAIFRYGCPPHGGVGFGLDRITQRLLKLENIKEAILLPRDPERMTP